MSRSARGARPVSRLAHAVAILGTVCAATALTAGAAAAGSPLPPATGTSSGPPASTASTPARVVDRTVTDPRVTESSGLVVSRRLDGVLWTFNDSGGTADLYGIGRSGAVTAQLDVPGAGALDWEAATPVTGRGGAPLVAIGDIGDNLGDRPVVRIVVVPEPARTGRSQVRPVRTIRLTYPDRPADAEAIFADPDTGRLYVVTKGLVGGRLYAVPSSAWPGSSTTTASVAATLEYVARVPLVMVTDGVALPDGRVALRTYGELAVMPPVSTIPPGLEDALWEPLATTVLPLQGQGEGLAVTPRGAFLLSTEGQGKPILRFTAPRDVMAARPAPTATTSTDRAKTAAAGSRDRGGSGTGLSANRATVLGTVAGGALVALAVAVAVGLQRRRG